MNIEMSCVVQNCTSECTIDGKKVEGRYLDRGYGERERDTLISKFEWWRLETGLWRRTYGSAMEVQEIK
jgi:hypothetical protein